MMDDSTIAQQDLSSIPPPSSLSSRRFRPYPEYKDSGVEWVASIPSHWETNPLKRLAESVNRGNSPDYVTESLIGVINQACIYWDGLRLDNRKFQKEHDVNGWKGLLKVGDLLINSTGTGTLGRACVFDAEGVFIADSHVTVVRLDIKRAVSKYVAYILQTPTYQGYIYTALVSGSTNQIELSQEGLKTTPLVLPPLHEQHAIAEFLDRETGKIDALVAKKEQLIELLQEKRTALITHAVTKGLDSDVPLKDSGVEWLGAMPAHWEVCHLRRVIEKFVDYRGKTPEKVPTGIPLITAKNIKNQTIDFSLSEEFISEDLYASWMVRGLPEVGDVLVTTEAPLGESAQIRESNIALAQRIILLKADKEKVSNDYLKYHFASNFGKSELLSKATGSTAFGIKASHFKATLMTVPPINEQKRITLHVDKEIEKIDGFIAKIREGIDRLKEFRTALISAAVTGKIDVREEVA